MPKNVIISKIKIFYKILREHLLFCLGAHCSFTINIGWKYPNIFKNSDDININPIQEFKNEIKTVSNFKELDKLSKSYISKKQTNLKLIENIKKNYYKKFNINKLIKIKNKIRYFNE